MHKYVQNRVLAYLVSPYTTYNLLIISILDLK